MAFGYWILTSAVLAMAGPALAQSPTESAAGTPVVWIGPPVTIGAPPAASAVNWTFDTKAGRASYRANGFGMVVTCRSGATVVEVDPELWGAADSLAVKFETREGAPLSQTWVRVKGGGYRSSEPVEVAKRLIDSRPFDLKVDGAGGLSHTVKLNGLMGVLYRVLPNCRDLPPPPPPPPPPPLPPGVRDRPAFVTAPQWTAKPAPGRIKRLAADLGVNASVVLRCQVRADGGLESCAVQQETPQGRKAGEAALTLTEDFRMKAVGNDGADLVGARVSLLIKFEP